MLRPRSLILFALIGLYPQVYAAHAQEQNFRISGTALDASSGLPLLVRVTLPEGQAVWLVELTGVQVAPEEVATSARNI